MRSARPILNQKCEACLTNHRMSALIKPVPACRHETANPSRNRTRLCASAYNAYRNLKIKHRVTISTAPSKRMKVESAFVFTKIYQTAKTAENPAENQLCRSKRPGRRRVTSHHHRRKISSSPAGAARHLGRRVSSACRYPLDIDNQRQRRYRA